MALPIQSKGQVPVTQDLFSLPENSQNRMHGARLGEWVGGMEPSPDGSFDAANTSSIHFSQGHLRPSRSSGPGQPQGGQGQPHPSRQFTQGQPHPLMGGSFDASVTGTPPLPRHPLRQTMPAGSEVFM